MKTKFRIPVMLFMAAMLCTLVIVSCKDDGDTTPPPDLTALKASITAAQAVADAAVEGKNDGQYPVGSKASLTAAITAAQAVVDNDATTQTEADNAKVSLDLAVSTFQALVIAPIAEEALIAHWSFDEGTGTTVGDNSANNFDGALKVGPVHANWESNLPTWAADRNGTANKAMNFNGGSVEVPYNTKLNPANAITVAVWVKADVVKPGNRFLGLQSWIAYKFELEDRKYPFFTWGGSDGNAYNRDANVAVPENVWHHVAVTYSAAESKMIFYVDGEPTNTVTDVNVTGLNISAKPYNLTIGQDFPTDKYGTDDDGTGFGDPESPNYRVIPAAWGGYFEGSLDEMRLYNIALSESQIASLYDREKP